MLRRLDAPSVAVGVLLGVVGSITAAWVGAGDRSTGPSSSTAITTITSASPAPTVTSSAPPPAPTAAGTSSATTTSTTPPVAAMIPFDVGVPAYLAPAAWAELLRDPASMQVRVAVLNPNSGPGLFPDPAFMAVVDEARRKGVSILGYVATGFGARNALEDEIDRYRRFYGVVDIFFDEVATDCMHLKTNYAPWIAAVRANGGTVAVNPGAHTEPCWADAADRVVTFEGPFGTYRSYQPPAWTLGVPASKIWHIVYAVRAVDLDEVRAIARRSNVGLLYATDDDLPNPYDTLPAWLVAPTPSTTVPVVPVSPVPPVPTVSVSVPALG